jgi:DNA (cytosine-5)-methyltransferase 1
MVEVLAGYESAAIGSVATNSEGGTLTQDHLVVIDDSDSSDTITADSTDAFDGFLTDGDSEDNVDILSVGDARTDLRPQRRSLAEKTVIPDFSSEGRTYKPGKSVELYDGTFLRILQVLSGDGEEIFLRGWPLQRQEDMNGLMPMRVNELCWIANISVGEAAAGITSNTDEVPLSAVKGLRIIRLTNEPYAERSPNIQNNLFTCDNERRREGLLFCRLRYIKIWDTNTARKQPVEEAIIFLTDSEADVGFRIDPEILRQQWRGKTVLGGTFKEYETHTTEDRISGRADIIDLSGSVATQTDDCRRRDVEKLSQKYTFGDSFCGAGGVSRGALQAGLRIVWAFDKCYKAMNSYRENFHTAIGETSDVADFLTNDPSNMRVDIIHFSPPCNTFSSAKTISAATDDDNESCIFSARPLIEAAKPRIATMEETAGLQERHEAFLYATIHTFIDLGYSTRWRQLNCLYYGVPQPRKRLIIIASGYVPCHTLLPSNLDVSLCFC